MCGKNIYSVKMERDGKIIHIMQASDFISLENMTINKRTYCKSDVCNKRGAITKRNLMAARCGAVCQGTALQAAK